MQKMKIFNVPYGERALVDTKGLQAITSSGRATAYKLGEAAGAKVKIGKRVLWNVHKINDYLEKLDA